MNAPGKLLEVAVKEVRNEEEYIHGEEKLKIVTEPPNLEIQTPKHEFAYANWEELVYKHWLSKYSSL